MNELDPLFDTLLHDIQHGCLRDAENGKVYVVRDIELEYYRDSQDERDKPPAFLERMINQGRLGVKSGRGFYSYPNPEFEQPGWLMKTAPWTPELAIELDVHKRL